MIRYYTFATLAMSTMVSHAEVVATTSFETTDGFSNTGALSAVNITHLNDASVWTTGVGNTAFNGVWSGDAKTGSLSAVIGNAGHFLMVDPDGADGVSSVTFSWNEYTSSSGTINIEWTTDGTTWTTAGTVTLGQAGANGYGETTINVNQDGDVKICWIVDASATGGASIDDVTINDNIAASTSFETADGFSNSGASTAINITASNDSAAWTSGTGNTNFNGIWNGDAKTGSLSAVIGNAGHFLMVDPAGTGGVSSVVFSWNEYTSSSGSINIEWSTDGTTWTTAGTVTLGSGGANGYGESTVNVNQAGDTKIRWIVDASATGGASIDDVTIYKNTNSVSLPSGTVVARIFDDNMVLQRNEPVKITGTDSANLGSQSISVSFDSQVKNTTTDVNGNWEVTLDAMSANATGQTLTVTGSTVETLTDILIGEVWVAAGQSNMNWTVSQSTNSAHASTYPLIRMCNWEGVVTTGSGDVYGATELANLTQDNFYSGSWQQMDATNVQAQSAVAYFFAHNLATDLNVPIGIVEVAYGGTSTEAFISPAAHATRPQLTEAFERPHLCTNLGQWTGVRLFKNVYDNDVANFTHADTSLPHPHPYAPGFLYHTGVEHLKNFTFKGAIWYQGESNAEFTTGKYQINGNRLADYQSEVMTTLINNWRATFGKADLPFYMVQLPRINGSSRSMWPFYREAQARVANDIDGVELATVMEYGDTGSDVHPPNKEPVGERLAAIARAKLYGDAVTYSGPVFTGHIVSGNKIILNFDHADGGLVDTDGGALEGFEISGADRNFIAATATIVGDTVEVTSGSVTAPVAVRHA